MPCEAAILARRDGRFGEPLVRLGSSLRRLRVPASWSAAVLSLLVAACWSTGTTSAPGGSNPGSSLEVRVERTIDVQMTAALRFEPSGSRFDLASVSAPG